MEIARYWRGQSERYNLRGTKLGDKIVFGVKPNIFIENESGIGGGATEEIISFEIVPQEKVLSMSSK